MSTTTADNLTIEEVIAPGLRLLRERRAMLEEQIRKVDVAVQALVALAEPGGRVAATPAVEPYSKSLTFTVSAETGRLQRAATQVENLQPSRPPSPRTAPVPSGGPVKAPYGTTPGLVRRAVLSFEKRFTVTDVVAFAKRERFIVDPQNVRNTIQQMMGQDLVRIVAYGKAPKSEGIYERVVVGQTSATEIKPDTPTPLAAVAVETRPRFARDDTMPINPARVMGQDRKRIDEEDLPEELKER